MTQEKRLVLTNIQECIGYTNEAGLKGVQQVRGRLTEQGNGLGCDLRLNTEQGAVVLEQSGHYFFGHKNAETERAVEEGKKAQKMITLTVTDSNKLLVDIEGDTRRVVENFFKHGRDAEIALGKKIREYPVEVKGKLLAHSWERDHGYDTAKNLLVHTKDHGLVHLNASKINKSAISLDKLVGKQVAVKLDYRQIQVKSLEKSLSR